MPDPRVKKLAEVLVNYSLELKPGETFVISTSAAADELSLAVYEQAVLAGAHVHSRISITGANEVYYKNASDAQLDYVSPISRYYYEKFDALLNIEAETNTRALSGVDPRKMQRSQQANKDVIETFMQRMATRELKWAMTVYPTNASAQEADMSLAEYQDFVYGAGMLDLEDPVQAWREEGQRQRGVIAWLDGHKSAVLKGANIDLTLSLEGRKFHEASGKLNFPDGEIYTSPIEDSVNGWVRFAYPAIFGGREVEDIELWFENGKVVKEKASKGQEFLTTMLDTDDGARYLGEWGIGTNYNIQKFTKNMLFDEKIGGTIHLAVGGGFPEVGGKNKSAIHWDMLCDMAESEVTIDGDLFYKDGKIVV